jgi:hypothetical protein
MSGATAAARVAGKAEPLRTHVFRGARHDCGDDPPPLWDFREDAAEPAPAVDDASLT